MSSDRVQKQIDNLLEGFTKTDNKLQALLFEEINKELEAFLSKENNNNDTTDRLFGFLSKLSGSVQE